MSYRIAAVCQPDAGAEWAHLASLLPAGITGVEGVFDAGDPVDLRDEQDTTVARGLVNYDAAEIPGLMGRSTRWLASKLGQEYEREVVHRDDLVILSPPGPAAQNNRTG